MSKTYNFKTAKNIVVGENIHNSITSHIDNIKNIKNVVIVAQPSMEKYGYVDNLVHQFSKKGIHTKIEYGIMPEPTESNIEEVAQSYVNEDVDLFVGIGGGSVLDATKLLAVLKTNKCDIQTILGTDLVENPGIPTVLIPSTTGTGSEVTPNAIVTFPNEELKIGIVSKYFLPNLVILDPVITVNLPKSITAATGMDAFTHAIESYISNKANPISDMFALESMRLISKNIVESFHNGQNIQARENMLLGSMYGGMALTSSGTAAVHAMAYPLGGKFDIAHGVANSMLLPHVMRFNFDAVPQDKIDTMIQVMDLNKENSDESVIVQQIESWVAELEIPQNLEEFGVKEKDIPELSSAAADVKRLLNNNPKEVSVEDMDRIYGLLIP